MHVTSYFLASAIMGGSSVVFILRTIKSTKDRRDSNRIYQFLCRRSKDGQYRFQSSEEISVVTNLSVRRVADLCSKHGHIEMKKQQRHTWRVAGSIPSSLPVKVTAKFASSNYSAADTQIVTR